MACCPSKSSFAAAGNVDSELRRLREPETFSGGARGEAVRFSGGASFIGTDKPALPFDGEGPRRPVRIKDFGIEPCCVSNARFAAFIKATGYLTDTERLGWSFVFQTFLDPALSASAPLDTPWWRKIEGANWQNPHGPGSEIVGREHHPVVHISWNDACAFASWCGGRLPTEAEWEHAARGGPADRRFPWGDDEPNDNKTFCNIWQGRFPDIDTAVDGFHGTAPIDAFQPNPAGLFNMAGNVWEWCQDAFRTRSLTRTGRERDRLAASEKERVLKGGSYLCHISYCYRYRIAARMGRAPDTSTGHIGFRVAYD